MKPVNIIDNILFVFFSNNIRYRDKASLLSKFKERTPFSNSQEIILPLPDDIPPDVPLMFLSKKGEFEIKFSKARIDFTSTNIKNFESNVKEIYEILDMEILHIGMVINSHINNFDKSLINSKIESLYSDIGKELFNITKSIETILRTLSHKEIQYNEEVIKINQSVMVSSSQTQVSVNFDQNTFPSNDLKVDKELISYFIKTTFQYSDTFNEDIKAKAFK
ncbi:hypothetical protein SDA22_07300 [Legionella pneumophila serogroup 1]|uniref:hypothetical protein n=1 Tax=Legionella pneumophila TaxID=446 RepID=UPI0007707C4B|nr:hypothetical protein [Legionella pneumophila]QIB22994.1 hypothetical protein GCO85_00840 [Legionella pneumophila]CZG80345.1 Uncharacterised protein [Legionella pneumophila]